MSLDLVNKTHLAVRLSELLCVKLSYRLTATASQTIRASALVSAEPVIIALMQFTDAVHNESSKAVEQLICVMIGFALAMAAVQISSADQRYCERSRLSPRGRRHRLGC